MRTDAFQFGRPVQIAFLVEARLDFHDARNLLAPFCCAYQRFDERRVVADAVSRHLDGDGLRIIRCRADEMLDARVKAFVRVVYQQVCSLHGGKDSALSHGQRRRPKRRPFLVSQCRERKTQKFKERGVVQLLLHLVHIDRAEIEARAEHFRDSRVSSRAKFKPHHWFVTALPNLLLDHGAKVSRRTLIDFYFGIPRDAA